MNSTKKNRKLQSISNVKIEVKDVNIENKTLKVIITDSNDEPYSWGAYYKIQKKKDNNWENLKTIEEAMHIDIEYILENNQIEIPIEYGKNYGVLTNGTYRIVKQVQDNEKMVDVYSDEFIIK